jgi:hypothetical protein
MNLERLLIDIGKVGAKVIFNKKEKGSEIVNINKIGSADMFQMLLNRLVSEGNYNKAENMLFNEFNNNSSYETYQIAEDFYNLLLKKSDEELHGGNFSREEVYRGLEDIKKFINKRE